MQEVMPLSFASVNIAGNASVLLHTLIGTTAITLVMGSLWFYLWAGSFLFGLERSFKQASSRNPNH